MRETCIVYEEVLPAKTGHEQQFCFGAVCLVKYTLLQVHTSGRGLARIRRLTGGQEIVGSNPIAPTISNLHPNPCKYGFKNVLAGDFCIQEKPRLEWGTRLWKVALSNCMKQGYSVYDLYYVVLARRNNAMLRACDGALLHLCKKLKIATARKLGRRLLLHKPEDARRSAEVQRKGKCCFWLSTVCICASCWNIL